MVRGSRRSRTPVKRDAKRRRRSSSSSSSRSRSSSGSSSQDSAAGFRKEMDRALRLRGNKCREIKGGNQLLEDVSRIAGACRVSKPDPAQLIAEQLSGPLRKDIQKAHGMVLEALKLRQKRMQESQGGSKEELERLQKELTEKDALLNAVEKDFMKERQALKAMKTKAKQAELDAKTKEQEILRRRKAIEKLRADLKRSAKKAGAKRKGSSSSSEDEMAQRRIADSSDDSTGDA
eukprot:TRINITY_DN3812_c2_g1_i1.p1 TRINITY_DN3812_c2_g1~~TRINITY_DN3812_c2_g1_i1.p1  ORF type:complete len:234 (+),score=99.16 TRINITY_DN3812_c2_g1_i1:87-788(+)